MLFPFASCTRRLVKAPRRSKNQRAVSNGFESLEDRRMLATIPVTLASDTFFNSGTDGGITLREAINYINRDPIEAGDANLNLFDPADLGTNDTIVFDDTVFGPGLAETIPLTAGQLPISQSVIIDATDTMGVPLGITIDAQDNSRIFNITGGAATNVVITDLRLINGDVRFDNGGAIYANSNLTLKQVVIENNNVLSAQGGGLYLDVPANASVFITESVIIGNTATPTSGSGGEGAGIFSKLATGALLEISDSKIRDGTSYEDGGGLYAELADGASLDIKDSDFLDNESTVGSGGGVFAELEGGATLKIRDSKFTGNDALGISTNGGTVGGGGVFAQVEEGGEVLISDSSVIGNTGYEGGGVLVDMRRPNGDDHASSNDSKVTITRSLVDNNTATNRGGGLFLDTGAGGVMDIVDSRITGNEAGLQKLAMLPWENAHSGGGIYAYLFSGDRLITDIPGSGYDNGAVDLVARMTISRTTIDDNEAGEHGGGVFICTKREVLDELAHPEMVRSKVDFTNSTISGNTAGLIEDPRPMYTGPVFGEGGGVHIAVFDNNSDIEGIDATFDSVTVTANKATHHGGGIFSLKPDEGDSRVNTILKNTIIAGNEDLISGAANNFYGSINVVETEYNLFGHQSSGTANTFYDHVTHNSVIFANLDTSNPDDGSTNNPDLGALMDNGGLWLTHQPNSGSPAIDNGSTDLTEDQRGFSRDMGDGDDIGAVETLAAADFDRDGDVDGFDFLLWQRGFGMSGNATSLDGDANGDGNVDAADLMIWSEQYGQGSTTINADFNGDGDVDTDDLDDWQQSYGQNNGGDADMDGDTDGLDFLAWQIQFLQETGTLNEVMNLVDTLQNLGEANQLVVSTTDDEDDGDISLSDMSLREAVKIANSSTVPTTVVLPTGRYLLDRTGTESSDASYNDLDITSDVTITGDGPGLSVIDVSGLVGASNNRAFQIDGLGSSLTASGISVSGGYSVVSGLAGTGFLVQDQGALELTDSAVVSNTSRGLGVGIRSQGGDVTVRRSVFTNNTVTQYEGAIFSTGIPGGYAGSLTIGDSIFALNQSPNGTRPNVWAANGIVKVNEGGNLYDNEEGNFFDQVPGVGDYLGTTGYVVSTVADTFDHTDDDESLSLREAIDLANTDSGASEVWLPAWDFVLTRDRGTNVTDNDISYGDLDIKDSLVVRGVTGATSVAWMQGIVDEVFDLVGDFGGSGLDLNDDGHVDFYDYDLWVDQNGSSGNFLTADADDDGDVDNDDLVLMQAHYGNDFDLFDVLV